MAEVLLFHHAQGLTPGVRGFADKISRAGHTVHVPDLYEGRVFDDLADAVAYASETGFGTIIERGQAAAEGPPPGLPGFSLRGGHHGVDELAGRASRRQACEVSPVLRRCSSEMND